MSRKFGGKCFFYSPRKVPDEAMTMVELGGLDGFNLEKSNPSVRDDEANNLMRRRREGGWRSEFRAGEDKSNRSTLAYPTASTSEWIHPRRLNDDQRA